MTWICSVTWSTGAVTNGYGQTREEAEQDLARNVSREPFNTGTIQVIKKSCSGP